MNPRNKRQEPPFSLFLFAITIGLTGALYALAARWVAPGLYEANLAAPDWKWAVVFLGGHGTNAFVEHLFHRYMLHRPFPFLTRLYRQHTLHHGLTNLKLIAVNGTEGRVFNRYPILEDKQHEASYFPWWTLGAFLAVSLLVVIPIQSLLPTWPVLLGSALAIIWSLCLYEIIHAVEHLSLEDFWRVKITHKRWGTLWTALYCFHLRHHADNGLNENISGFFAVPVADFLFGTYAPWNHVFSDGERTTRMDFEAAAPAPCRLIRFLDQFMPQAT